MPMRHISFYDIRNDTWNGLMEVWQNAIRYWMPLPEHPSRKNLLAARDWFEVKNGVTSRIIPGATKEIPSSVV